MTELRSKLEEIGLQGYHDVFMDEGFDNWDTILDITEADLEALNVKLGHRRKLQRAIYLYRRPALDDTQSELTSAIPSPEIPATKRKYKRHPKPDPNAPEKPHSAYVLFSNDVRRDLDDKDISFAEMAKIVGERWQALESDTRQNYEAVAVEAKSKYHEQLSEYKKTEEYRHYQDYLVDFRSKSRPQPSAPGSEESQRKRKSPSLLTLHDTESLPDVTPRTHSRASSTSEMTALLERTGVAFSDSSQGRGIASARKMVSDDPTPRPASSRTTPSAVKTPALAGHQAQQFPRRTEGLFWTEIPPNLRRDSSSGGTTISNPSFDLNQVPGMTSVEQLIPRPRLSNTRMSSNESERSGSWEHVQQQNSHGSSSANNPPQYPKGPQLPGPDTMNRG